MRTRKLIAAAVASLPLTLALPGPASAECVNGGNVSVAGNATQTNECTTVVSTPTATTPPLPTPRAAARGRRPRPRRGLHRYIPPCSSNQCNVG